ncbi:MAG TPA: FAD-dependent oxidoreductase, partial [Longimicrobiales bacterium]|nr:FAD-dependent oxidoreductase [Longimicrobiales bacterium]
GGGIFHDAQMHHPPRLVVSMLRSAHRDGAVLANYAEVTELVREGTRVVGARVTDREGGGSLEIRARVVVVAAGAWSDELLPRGRAGGRREAATFSRDVCLVTDIPARHGCALAVPGGGRDPDALLSRSGRHLFVVPWLGRLIVGVWHRVHEPRPDELELREEEVEGFVGEVAEACPGLGLTPRRVVAHNTGLVLVEDRGPEDTSPRFGKRSRLVDHRREGLEGLVSIVGVRLTTARYDAARTLDLAAEQLPGSVAPCRTARTPLFGADFETVAGLRDEVASSWEGLSAEAVETLWRCYGSAHGRVRDRVTCPELGRPLPGSRVLGAEVVHAVREEMALHLDDVVLRRTVLGAHGPPDEDALEAASRIMAREAGWDEARRRRELALARDAAAGPAAVLPARTHRGP